MSNPGNGNLYNLTNSGASSKRWIINNVDNIFVDASNNFTVSSIFSDSTTRQNKFPSPYVGQMSFLTGTGTLQIYYNSTWNTIYNSLLSLSLSAGITSYSTATYVTSGNISNPTPVAGGFTIYTIKDTSGTAPGTIRTGTFTPNFTGTITYLIVAGGGGGGSDTNYSGGGGAGGLLEGTISVTSGVAYTISIGAGGTINTNGSDSSISGPSLTTITCTGGGAGGGTNYASGNSGGSGGGGAGSNNQGIYPPSYTNYGNGNTPATTPSQGNRGGGGARTGGAVGDAGGGGGGAGAVGSSSDGSSGSNNGGIGSTSTIQGSPSVYYAGGGGGRSGAGGTGGGGGTIGSTGSPGTNGFGGGGQGGGGSGGSGVIILRFSSY